jgi:hypothetical protein
MDKKIIPGKPERRWTLQSRDPSAPGGAPSADAASNYVDRRTRRDRRVVYDRRDLIRFDVDRRNVAGAERRLDVDPWAFP